MRLLMMFITINLTLLGLQGCATTTSTDTVMPQQVITSPAERISAGSGSMHTGMSGAY